MPIGGLRLPFLRTARMLITEGYLSTRKIYIATTAINVSVIQYDAFSIRPSIR